MRTRKLLAGSVVAVAVLVLWHLIATEILPGRTPTEQVASVLVALSAGYGAAAWVTSPDSQRSTVSGKVVPHDRPHAPGHVGGTSDAQGTPANIVIDHRTDVIGN